MCSRWQRILMNLWLGYCRFYSWPFGARIFPRYRPLFQPIMFSRSVRILLFLWGSTIWFKPLFPWDLFTGISVCVSFLHDQTFWLIQLCGPPTQPPNQYHWANDWNRELVWQSTLMSLFWSDFKAEEVCQFTALCFFILSKNWIEMPATQKCLLFSET